MRWSARTRLGGAIALGALLPALLVGSGTDGLADAAGATASADRAAGLVRHHWSDALARAGRGLGRLPIHVVDAPRPTPRVINGTLDTVTAWPWIASLEDVDVLGRRAHICGGSLVDERWVLTAAHCVGSGPLDPDVVVLGQSTLSASTGQIVEIDAIVTWPFGETTDGSPRDLAMLHLAEDADTARADIEPIPLLAPSEIGWAAPGDPASLAGWGVINEYDGTAPDRLRSADVSIVGDTRCAAVYDTFGIDIDPASWVCGMSSAQSPSDLGRGPCFGDSGGPLVVFDPNDPSPAGARLVGATSFGLVCGSPTIPSVWAQVTAERTVIEGLIAGSVDMSELTIDTTGGALAVEGTSAPDLLWLYCAADHLWLSGVRLAVGGVPVDCPGSAITSASFLGRGGSDLLALEAIDAGFTTGLATVTVDLGASGGALPLLNGVGADLPGNPRGDVVLVATRPTTPVDATTSGNVLDLGAAGPALALAGTEILLLQTGDLGDSIDLATLTVPTWVIPGLGGDDLVVGTQASDRIEAFEGDDVVAGGPGDDAIDGGSGRDQLDGGGGGDRLVGGLDVDLVAGGSGGDVIEWVAGSDNDAITGGSGADTVGIVVIGGEELEGAELRAQRFARRQGYALGDVHIETGLRVSGRTGHTLVTVALTVEIEGIELTPADQALFDSMFSAFGGRVRIIDANLLSIVSEASGTTVSVNGTREGLPGVPSLDVSLGRGADTVRTTFFEDTAQHFAGGGGRDAIGVDDRGRTARVVGGRITAPGFGPIETESFEVIRVA